MGKVVGYMESYGYIFKLDIQDLSKRPSSQMILAFGIGTIIGSGVNGGSSNTIAVFIMNK